MAPGACNPTHMRPLAAAGLCGTGASGRSWAITSFSVTMSKSAAFTRCTSDHVFNSRTPSTRR
jgi:hypothetical protein